MRKRKRSKRRAIPQRIALRALKVTPNLPEKLKKYHLAPEVGHYGIFNGSRWRTSIAPVVEGWIRSNATARKLSVVA